MKKILSIVLHFLRRAAESKKDYDEEIWKHLDGAEFLAILPESAPRLTAE